MTCRFPFLSGLVTLAALAVGTPAQGQGVYTQWNFPTDFNTTNPAPSVGSGTALLIGSTTGVSAAGNVNGGSTDQTATQAWNISSFPAQSTGSGTAGVRFNISTAGVTDPLIFRFDHRPSGTASRFMRVEYTLNGGTSWTSLGIFDSNYGHDIWYNNRTLDLSGVSGATNNANFGVRIVSIFEPPSGTSYLPANPIATYGTNGTWRFDTVTLSTGHVWIGGSGSSLATPANYQAGTPPSGTTSTLLLGTAGGSNTTVTTASVANQFDQIIFQNNAPSYTINGTDSLTLNAGLVNNATNSQTISVSFTTFGRSNAIQTVNDSRLTFTTGVAFTNFLTIMGTWSGSSTQGGTVVFNSDVTGVLSNATNGNPSQPTVRVTRGTTLAGTGTFGPAASNQVNIQVLAGARLRPGNPDAVGTLTVGGTGANSNVTFNADSIWAVRINSSGSPSAVNTGGSSTGSNNNLLTILGLGSLTVDNNTRFVIDGTGAGFSTSQTYSYQIGQAPNNLSSLNITNQSLFSTIGFNAADHIFSLTGNASGAVFLNIVPVPEPGAVLGLAAGALGLGVLLRGRRQSRRPGEAPVAV
jgi:hypothetical protein